MERQVPKNVRQIGNVSDSSKIYVEDYVDTFFNQLCEKAEQEMVGAFLIGEKVQEEEQDYIYIYGAIQMQDLIKKGKDFVIEEETWKRACETCKEYFGDGEILGWFVVGGEHCLEVNHNITKIHQKYFPREKSIFITKNIRDKEEKFYIYKFHNMMECGGHYVYYEKNLEMQNYMIASRKRIGFTPSEIIDDRVIQNFRSIIKEKTEQTGQKNHSRLVYGLSTFLVLIIVIIGVTMLNDYGKMQKVQDSLNQLSEKDKQDEEEEMIQASGDIINKEEPEETPEEQEPQGEEHEPSEEDSETTENVEIPDQTISEEMAEPEVYIVKKGDTLQIISRETYGDTSHVDAICKLNGLEDGNLIIVGQKLLLP